MFKHHVVLDTHTCAGTIGRRACSILLLALLVALIPVTPQVQASLRAQPELITLAQETPAATVGVIVQKTGVGTNLEQRVMQLGGVVTLDLHIINAFAAKLPARAVLALARMSGVRWVSLDAPVVRTTTCTQCVNTANLTNAYNAAIGVNQLWNVGPKYLQGQGIGVAVVDSGMNPIDDFYNGGTARIVASAYFNNGYNQHIFDKYGHGQHVGGIIGGNGNMSNGQYIGVAPKVNLINVKVSDDYGASNASNVVAGLQWIYNNRTQYNIRVVNISLNNSVNESYHTNPIDAAVEVLWFNQVVVVVAAGNNGKNALYPPANDPFVITVGATDDRGTLSTSDDVLASFSGYGQTIDGFSKPDLVAPGRNIVSLLAPTTPVLVQQHPGNVVNSNYFRMSGTSMSAPMVTGAVALLLQDEPTLTPDQVKYRLKATARPFDTATRAGAGHLDAYAAVYGTTTQSANTGVQVSQLLSAGGNSSNWNSVSWGSVSWGSVSWGSVSWGSVSWGSDDWN
jgi:serine protease AprX